MSPRSSVCRRPEAPRQARRPSPSRVARRSEFPACVEGVLDSVQLSLDSALAASEIKEIAHVAAKQVRRHVEVSGATPLAEK
eukprot:1201700-Pyramimonas_sp.AAC.1